MAGEKFVKYKNGKFSTSDEGGGGGGSSTFAGLDDVSFSNLQNGQVPKYNSTTQKWENANESGGGTVTDVTVDGTSVVNQQGVAEIPAIPDGLHHYSTTEQVVGTWIDGKPLYEKTFDFGQDLQIVAQDWNDTPILKGNIERIIYGEIRNTNYAVWPIAIRTNASSNYVQIMNMRPSGSNINARYFTIRYTKTTD